MILMESSSLASIQRLSERGSNRLRLTGRVSVYRDRNYLLATVAPQAERVEPAPAATTHTDTKKPTDAKTEPAAAPPKPSADPSVDEIVAELEKAAPARPAASVSSNTSTPASHTPPPDAASANIAPAGFLAGRRARVVRTADGTLQARFDSGPDDKTEAPMVLLPCQNLAVIESVLEAQGTGLNAGAESVTFTLTGQVQVYRGRNYLLVTMYIINKPQQMVNSGQ
jgi:hypothetical protein